MDEPALIAASQRGDLTAFNQLVELYQGALLNHAARMLSSVASAEDATQEAFISAFRHIRSFKGGSFRGWLFRIATNACYDQMRAAQRRPGPSLDAFLENPGWQPASGDATPEQAALQSELAREIQRAIERLPSDQRGVLLLADVEGLSYEEVAEAMECNVGTVKSRLSRARARVRTELSSKRELLPGWLRLEPEEDKA